MNLPRWALAGIIQLISSVKSAEQGGKRSAVGAQRVFAAEGKVSPSSFPGPLLFGHLLEPKAELWPQGQHLVPSRCLV